jgi:hypothetical protein
MDDCHCGYIKQLEKNTLLSLQFVAELIFSWTDWWVLPRLDIIEVFMKHLVRFAKYIPYTGAIFFNQELKTPNKLLQKNEVRYKRIDRNLHSSSKIMTNYSEVKFTVSAGGNVDICEY